MYRPRAFAVDDVSVLHEVMRRRSFATIAAIIQGEVQFAYAPLIVDTEPQPLGSARFHLACNNPFAEMDGLAVRLSFLGADAYVSPDWYETKGSVPTWNYITVEASGHAEPLDGDELCRLLANLSELHEERLRPKQPWTLDKLSQERLSVLLNGIRGFVVAFNSLEGKFKLSQDKSPANIAGVMAGLEARADAASMAVTRAMRERWPDVAGASTSSV